MEKVLLGLFFIALGCFAVLAAAFSWRRTRRLVAESVSPPGEVVALTQRRGRRVLSAPVVRFTGPDGRAVEFADEVSRNPPGYRVGDRAHVRISCGFGAAVWPRATPPRRHRRTVAAKQ